MKTIAQIAAELGVTKPAVRKYLSDEIRANHIEMRDGVIYIDGTGESQLKSKIKSKVGSANSETPETISETAETQSKTGGNFSANESETVSSLIVMLQNQLEIKDKQISDLNDRLAEAHQELRAAQTLHAGTQTQFLTDGSAPASEKVSLWNKLFKRKN